MSKCWFHHTSFCSWSNLPCSTPLLQPVCAFHGQLQPVTTGSQFLGKPLVLEVWDTILVVELKIFFRKLMLTSTPCDKALNCSAWFLRVIFGMCTTTNWWWMMARAAYCGKSVTYSMLRVLFFVVNWIPYFCATCYGERNVVRCEDLWLDIIYIHQV